MLTGKQRRRLRALGHHLDPVVQIGKEGLSEGLCKGAAEALSDHKLIKVRLGEAAPLARHEAAGALAARLSAELIQVLGRTLLLYRRRQEPDPRPRIDL